MYTHADQYLCTCIRRVKYTGRKNTLLTLLLIFYPWGFLHIFLFWVFCVLFVCFFTSVMNHELFLKARQIHKAETMLKSRIPANFASGSTKLAFHADNAKGLENIASLPWGMLAARSVCNSSPQPSTDKVHDQTWTAALQREHLAKIHSLMLMGQSWFRAFFMIFHITLLSWTHNRKKNIEPRYFPVCSMSCTGLNSEPSIKSKPQEDTESTSACQRESLCLGSQLNFAFQNRKKPEELQLNKTAGISPISYTDPGDYICQMVFHVLRLQSLLWVLFWLP